MKTLFHNIIYCGFHYPADGLGNLFGLLDSLIFNGPEIKHKSFCLSYGREEQHKNYGKVIEYLHLKNPDVFKGSLFVDTCGVLTDEKLITKQINRVAEYKKCFNAVTAYYLMWESDRLWEPLVDLVKAYDFCIVTSNVLDKFLKKNKIDFVHLKHPYQFKILEGPLHLRNKNHLTFGVSACFWERKNIPLLVESFIAIFKNNPAFRLKIHTRFDYKDPTRLKEYLKIKKYLKKSTNIEIIEKTLSRNKYIDWMNSVDVYCFISSCEGYSITPREALHLGKPVVLLDSHVHKDFSHLPGIVRVKPGKKKKAAWWVNKNHNIGYYWSVDKKSLNDSLNFAAKNYARLKKELKDNFEEVRQYHNLKTIKSEWINTLNNKYKEHIKKVNFSCSKIISSEYEELAKKNKPFGSQIIYKMDDDYIKHNTGKTIGDKHFCFRTKHKKGHCVFGPRIQIMKSFLFRVTFFLEFINIFEEEEDLINLDVYNSKNNKILTNKNIFFKSLKSMEGKFSLEFKGAASQVLEFRVFWNNNCDIAVSKIVLEKARNI